MANKTKAKNPKAAKAVKKRATPKQVIAPKIVKPKADKPVKTKTPKGESKLDKVIALLSRLQGATVQELMDVTTWQQHTVRSTLSTLGKKRGYKIVSRKDDGKSKERVYKIEGETNKTDE